MLAALGNTCTAAENANSDVLFPFIPLFQQYVCSWGKFKVYQHVLECFQLNLASKVQEPFPHGLVASKFSAVGSSPPLYSLYPYGALWTPQGLSSLSQICFSLKL